MTLAERLRLIVITDPELGSPRSLESTVAGALAAGAGAIQLRDKEAGAGVLLPVARRVRDLCRVAGALFFVNDRVDLALAAGADGVHLGPDDLPVATVRHVVPSTFLIGFSADDPEVARRAEADGADFLGCGTIWTTGSKADAGKAVGPEGLARVSRAVRIPVVGVGGITTARLPQLEGTGAAGIAVIGAVFGSADPGGAVRELLAALPLGM